MFEGCRGGGSGGGGGVPDQFRHYIASRTSISLPISFPPPPSPHLHHHGLAASVISSNFAAGGGGFESFPPAALVFPPPPPPPPSHHNHHHHHNGLQSSSVSNNKSSTHHQDGVNNKEEAAAAANNLVVERERSSSILSISIPEGVVVKASWTNDEILALLRIRSAMENWFPDFTWEHVSRKLAEVGFEKSAEKCKEKFEEESRNFSSMNYSKFFVSSDFDELYHIHGHHQHHHHQNPQEKAPAPDITVKKDGGEKEIVMEEEGNNGLSVGCDDDEEEIEKNSKIVMCKKKRKRESEKEEEEFEMFKGFCEGIVRKIIEQQEELHNKIMKDVIRRDEESIAREEAWKTQEIDRINKEMEIRAKEQAVAVDRQTKIIQFLKKFTSSSSDYNYCYDQNLFQQFFTTDQQPTSSSTENTPSPEHEPDHDPNQDQDQDHHGCSRKCNTNDSTTTATQAATVPKKFSMDEKLGERDITGKRWPRDEVMALINLRCSFNNNNNNSNEETNNYINGSWKGPLWERISQKMSELGYQRSAKRCKEKWENINKYFRKTKDNKKKRSMDSRTCPYFHQLSNLYRQSPGTLVPENP